ncbi:predicted protein [Nematostella vectensis]|uniref:Uncharacterized protein n=1 Tax=Nematostella vectensis TaxID=45351 RepID=A7SZF1_NEMVE|nr:predicted protein [Nematostella vectensis]|eukprot:XP_001623015.1 predicted protein [Nematostella vectensis]
MRCIASGTAPLRVAIFHPNGSVLTNTGIYTFSPITRRDGGTYTCTVNNGNECSNDTNTTSITVNYKPENTELIPNEHIGCVRDVVSLNCSALANPNNINYTLYRNDTALASNMNGKFVISLNASGLSIFKCVPSNEVGNGENKSGFFAVKDPPRITSFTSPQIEVEGSDVTMRCIASGTAPLRVAIFHPNGSVLTNTGSYTFSPITRRDGGTYTCTVNNGNECPAYTRTTSITVIYASLNKPNAICLANDALTNVTVEMKTNLLQPPVVTCTTGRASLISFSADNKNAFYAVPLKRGQNISCSVEGYPLANITFYLDIRRTNLIMSWRIRNKNAIQKDGKWDVTDNDRQQIENLEYFKSELLKNAPNYGLDIDPNSVKPLAAIPSNNVPLPLTTQAAPITAATPTTAATTKPGKCLTGLGLFGEEVRESIDTTCLKGIFLSYGSGSVLVYVSLVLTANIADPFVLLKHALVKNAPRYGFAIEPASVKIQLPESLPQLSDVMPASSSLKVTWSNATRNSQCTMRARPLAGASRDWVTSSGVSNSALLSCVLNNLKPDTLYEVEVTVSVRGDTRRDTVYIRTTQSGVIIGTAVEVNDQNSTIVGLAVLVAILFLVIICLIVYIAVLKRAGLTAKRERSEADNPGYSGFQNVAMQENVNQDVAPSDNRGPTPDPIPQYESVNNTPAQPTNRSNVTQYEDVTQGSNVTQYEDITQEGNVTQYKAMNRHASRDRHVPGNRQYDSVDSTRMSRWNPPARRARNDTGDQGEPGYENTRKRGLPHEVYQSLQATTQHSENAHYAPLHPGTRIAARPGGRDERGVGTDIRGSEYQELNRAKTTDPCYQPNVAMQENVNQDRNTIPGMGDYEVDYRGHNPDPIPQYESVNNAQTQPPNRRNVTQYEDVTQGSNVTQYEDVTQEGNVTQYEAMNRHASRDRHVPGNRQYDCVDSTRMSRQNPPARRARNDTGDQGEPGYENTRKRGLPHEVYQSLQATTQHSENAQYAPLHPGTLIAARPGGRDERGVGTDIRGTEERSSSMGSIDLVFLVGALVCLIITSTDASSGTWQWQYNTSVCSNDDENATLTWRVTLNSGEEIGAVSIWRQPVKAGGSPVQMYSTTSGKGSAFSDRVMSVSFTGSSPVYDVVFILKVNNSKDGFGTKQIQCRVNSKNFLVGQAASDTILKVQGNELI